MEEIVKRLSEIETEAVRIMDDSAVQKKEMDAESEERLRKYDEESNEKTAAEPQCAGRCPSGGVTSGKIRYRKRESCRKEY